MVIENANTDQEMRRHNWRVHGEKGRKPGYAPAVPCCALLVYKLSRCIPGLHQPMLLPMCSALIMACHLIATSCCGRSSHQLIEAGVSVKEVCYTCITGCSERD